MDELTKNEKKCCHMSAQQFDYSTKTLGQWRQEFNSIPRDEHCRDCPALSSPERQT